MDDKLPLMGVVRCHVTLISILGLQYHIFGIGEARRFKFGVLIDAEDY